MEYYAIFIPNNTSNFAIKSFYNDKAEALAALKVHKDARMKSFPSSEEAVYFYLHGPADGGGSTGGGGGAAAAASLVPPGSPIPPAERKVPKSPFIAPSSQKLVAFRKLIEANNVEEVRATIQQNPRYLISSGDTPTILKEGPRYNALHITAIEGRGEICRLILQTIESATYIELLHGQRSASTDEVTAILLDLYLNTPDKCRNETPLHFAAKLGWVEVVRELIAFPQCQVKPNADGLYPRDIICSRARPANNTPEVRAAIDALLRENFFVPVIRAEDNTLPPVVGEPFSPTELPKLEGAGPRDKLGARREIKAYAGPMDHDKAQRFCKRWKTPPRLKVLGSAAAKVQSDGKLSELRQCSTPIKGGTARRLLFANRSFDGRLEEVTATGMDGEQVEEEEEEEEEEEQRNNNNHSLVEASLDESLVQPVEKLLPDDNGNHLRLSVPYTPNRLFFSYRTNHLANASFDTNGSYCDSEPDEGNFSYVCEETQTLYGKANVTESPSFKERSIRLADPAKGLETVGRMLAEKEQVGWKEHWSFLGTFCNMAEEAGLTLLDRYLAQRKQQLEGASRQPEPIVPPADTGEEVPAVQRGDAGDRSFSDELNMICESTEKMTLNMAGDGELHRTAVSNPYRCLLNSLHVFGTRLVNNVAKATAKPGDCTAAEMFQGEIRKVEKLLENYRNDGAFRVVDFSKVHSLFAYLIVANVAHNRTGEELASIWRPLVQTNGSLHDAAKCVGTFLEQYSSLAATITPLDFADQSGWSENEHIAPCGCRTGATTIHAGTGGAPGIMERMNKRREKRAIRTTPASEPVPAPVVVDFHTYRSGGGKEPLQLNGSKDEEELYYSCSDSENEQEEDAFFTPPSSPKALRKDRNGNNSSGHHETTDGLLNGAIHADEGALLNGSMDTSPVVEERQEQQQKASYTAFISETMPTKQDFDVWNVLKMVEIDPQAHPHVHAWKCAMVEYGS
ncbi:ankyrin repeat and LEM domain-containing protein 2 homolog [Anopheles merus]|uniref:ankyrin repeat and LEM domain-containing protein 2 homolog n=1 Tax=Anopheles merus TaxID=30066 RepID=UPI001BE47B68|nr:ankyrin repeat and LEM domain-containing protein 2 homolog [Anopheles merus]